MQVSAIIAGVHGSWTKAFVKKYADSDKVKDEYYELVDSSRDWKYQKKKKPFNGQMLDFTIEPVEGGKYPVCDFICQPIACAACACVCP